MKISTKGRYGARAMLVLASHHNDRLVRAIEISEDQGISLKYLESILATLKAAGLIISERGKSGGYSLARDPAQISLFDVLSPLENSMDFVHCANGGQDCQRIDQCVTRSVWAELQQVTYAILQRTNLAELVRRREALETLQTLDGPLSCQALPIAPAEAS